MRVYFEAYGCTLNYGEARMMEALVVANKHSIVDDMKYADILVLVTCTVIEATERKMLKRIREMLLTGKPLVVAGCMAAVQKHEIMNISSGINILPPSKLTDIVEVCKKLKKTLAVQDEEANNPLSQKDIEKEPVATIRNWQNKTDVLPTGTISKHINRVTHSPVVHTATVDAIIPIAQGCLGECTYCITRFARGRLRSYTIEHIINNIKTNLERGCMEIRLTAQDTSGYGSDIGTDLPTLIDRVTDLPGDFRIRIGMMNPSGAGRILKNLLNSYRSPKVYKFIHLPVQSGSDAILNKMKRPYSVNEFKNIIRTIRSEYPEITLSTDIIVGFPGETEEQFMESQKLISDIKPDIVNITRYSARPGTTAEKMNRQVVSRISKERSRKLAGLRFDISLEINKRQIGKRHRILITETGKRNTIIGRTDEYRPVVIAEKLSLGRYANVEIIGAKSVYLEGRLVD